MLDAEIYPVVVVKSMQEAVMENSVSLHASTYRELVKRAMANGCIGLDPQRNGGQALP